MANNNPAANEQSLRNAIKAWRTLRPTKKFLGKTVDEFEVELKPCFDAREDIEELDSQLTGARNVRDSRDVQGLDLVTRLVNAIKADENEGENSELLEVMGYVIKSKRKSGLHRNTPESNSTPIPKAA